ncbi:hypothetical protein M422DRAFT_247894 [Sphaerobolus stellatus SS14]|nr:hypothetical protein M422DRAFT_247894 [Sphaerobolus stellatus SS14]
MDGCYGKIGAVSSCPREANPHVHLETEEELCEGHQRCFGTLDQVYTGPKTSGDSKNDPRRTVAGFKKDKKYNAKAPDLNMPFLRRQEAKKMAVDEYWKYRDAERDRRERVFK